MKHKLLEQCSLWMALYDFVPCILFAISCGLIYLIFPSYVFLIGAILANLAGFFKAGWKLILALFKKSIPWLQQQFKYCMGSGFTLMILAMIIDHKLVNFERFFEEVTSFPACVFLILMMVGYGGMSYAKKKFDSSTARANYIEQTINSFTQLSFLIAVTIMYTSAISYQPTETAYTYLESTSEVTVVANSQGYYFDGYGSDLLVFYPGAFVEAASYSELCSSLAEEGLDCFICKMPLNFALINSNAADYPITKIHHDHIYLAGHSLGGVVASFYCNEHAIDGLILLASYATKPQTQPVCTIYGSEDKVLNSEEYTNNLSNVAANLEEHILPGGNHANFANYGFQAGDGEASISSSQQIQLTKDIILSFIQ